MARFGPVITAMVTAELGRPNHCNQVGMASRTDGHAASTARYPISRPASAARIGRRTVSPLWLLRTGAA